MKKYKYLLLILFIMILIYVSDNDNPIPRETYSSHIITAGENQVLSVIQNGKDWTEEYIELKSQTEKVIAKYFQVKPESLKFSCYTMLGMEGMTVNVECKGKHYLFVCDIEGNILSSKAISE